MEEKWLDFFGSILCGCSTEAEGEIVIPKGVVRIQTTNIDSEGGVFYDCTKITSIVIPEGVEYIGDNAFYGCKNLESIVIPKTVKRIGTNAFYGCSSLKSVTIGNSTIEIEDASTISSLL